MLTKSLLVVPLLGFAAMLTGCVTEPEYVDERPARVYAPGPVYVDRRPVYGEPGYYDGGPNVVEVRTVEHDRYVDREHYRGGRDDRYRTSEHRRPAGYGGDHRGNYGRVSPPGPSPRFGQRSSAGRSSSGGAVHKPDPRNQGKKDDKKHDKHEG